MCRGNKRLFFYSNFKYRISSAEIKLIIKVIDVYFFKLNFFPYLINDKTIKCNLLIIAWQNDPIYCFIVFLCSQQRANQFIFGIISFSYYKQKKLCCALSKKTFIIIYRPSGKIEWNTDNLFFPLELSWPFKMYVIKLAKNLTTTKCFSD